MTIEKYRAWDKTRSKMFDITLINFQDKLVNMIYDNKSDWKETREIIKDCNVPFSRIELMECLEVKDKKGKEIWEGDIVELAYDYHKEISIFGNVFGVINWDSKDCSFNIKQISKDTFKFDKNATYEDDNDLVFYDYDGTQFNWEWLEVVGNVYENREFYERELEKYELGNKEE